MFTAMVLMHVQRGSVNETAQRLLAIEGVAEVYSVTGEYDLVAIIRVQQYEDLAEVVTARIGAVSTITDTETLMAFKVFSRDDLQQAWDLGIE